MGPYASGNYHFFGLVLILCFMIEGTIGPDLYLNCFQQFDTVGNTICHFIPAIATAVAGGMALFHLYKTHHIFPACFKPAQPEPGASSLIHVNQEKYTNHQEKEGAGQARRIAKYGQEYGETNGCNGKQQCEYVKEIIQE